MADNRKDALRGLRDEYNAISEPRDLEVENVPWGVLVMAQNVASQSYILLRLIRADPRQAEWVEVAESLLDRSMAVAAQAARDVAISKLEDSESQMKARARIGEIEELATEIWKLAVPIIDQA